MGIKINQSDIIWNYIGTIVSLSTNFILLPFIMHYLDGETLGLWYVFLSIGGIVTLFDFGFNPAFARNVAYCWCGATKLIEQDVEYVEGFSEPNLRLLNQVIIACKRIYFIISISALGAMISIGSLYIIYISTGFNGYNYLIAWAIYSIAVFFNLLYGYYATFLKGIGAIKQYNKAIVFSRILQIVICIFLLILGYGILATAFAYFVFGLMFRLLARKYFLRYECIGEKLKEINGRDISIDVKKTFQIIWHNAWREGLVQLSIYLSSQATIFICSVFFTLTETGSYSISLQMVMAIAILADAMYTAKQPALQSAYIRKNKKESNNIMSQAMFIYLCTFAIGVAGVCTIGIPLLSIIQSKIYISIHIVLLLSVYEFLYKRHSIYASFISNTNDIPYMSAFLISSVASIILAIVLIYTIPQLGILNLILAQIVIQMMYNNWKWPWKVHKMLDTNSLQMLKNGLVQTYKHITNSIKY